MPFASAGNSVRPLLLLICTLLLVQLAIPARLWAITGTTPITGNLTVQAGTATIEIST